MSESISQSHPQPIVVIGAGVLGLSSALTLQKRYPNHPIAIVAAEIPSLPSSWGANQTPAESGVEKTPRPSADYASMWAGAHYRPIPRSSRQLEEESDLAFITRDRMLEIVKNNPPDECGVAVTPAVELLERPSAVELGMKTGDQYAGADDEFQVLNEAELKQYSSHNGRDEARWGCKYSSYCVNVHVYCNWLYNTFITRGGRILRRQLVSLEHAFGAVVEPNQPYGPLVENLRPLVVNCSGRNFDMDSAVKIIRGQTVLVKNEYHTTVTRQMADGGWSFLIPRPGGGGTVVGGTKEVGDREVEARESTRRELLVNAAKYFPDFVSQVDEFDVVMDNVGRRPWREGGLRLEIEILDGEKKVIHGYGAGGRGYEISWGVAERVAALADSLLS